MRRLLDSIAPDSVKGLRDRTVIAVMAFTFARVRAVSGLRRSDYTLQGKRARLRLLEKGGKEKLVWLHHEAEEYLDGYLAAGSLDGKAPLFQTVSRSHQLTGKAMSRSDMLRMVKADVLPLRFLPTSATIPFGARALRSFCKTGARSRRRKIWPIIPIPAPPSSTIAGRIWRPSARSSGELPSKTVLTGDQYPRPSH